MSVCVALSTGVWFHPALRALGHPSLTFLSARPAATDRLTGAGASVLNPFLAGRDLGVPGQVTQPYRRGQGASINPLSLSVLRVVVLDGDHRAFVSGWRARDLYARRRDVLRADQSRLQRASGTSSRSCQISRCSTDNIPILPGGPTVVGCPRSSSHSLKKSAPPLPPPSRFRPPAPAGPAAYGSG
jgi:hypothetical protein